MADLLAEQLQALRGENLAYQVGVTTPAQSAAGATAEHLLYTDAFLAADEVGGTVSNVVYVPEATITGANTNNATVSVEQYDNTGAHVNQVAAITFSLGKNGVANDQTLLTIANADLVPNATLTYKLLQNGTGLALPAGRIQVLLSQASR